MATKIRLSNLTQPLDQDLSVPNLTANGNITATGDLAVSGNTATTYLNASGAVNVDSYVSIFNDSMVFKDFALDEKVRIYGMSGDATFAGTITSDSLNVNQATQGSYPVSIKGSSNGYGLNLVSDSTGESTFFSNTITHGGDLTGASMFVLKSDNTVANSGRSQLAILGNTNQGQHRFGIGIDTNNEIAYLATQTKVNTAIPMPLEFRVNNTRGLIIDESVNVYVDNDLNVSANTTLSGLLKLDYLNPRIDFQGDDGIIYRISVDETPNQLSFGHSTNRAFYVNNTGYTNFNYNVGVAGNLNVVGDFTVSGNTTSVNTNNLDVEDAVITLNSGQTSPFNTTGLLLQRYDTANSTNWNVFSGFNEVTDEYLITSTTHSGSPSSNTDISYDFGLRLALPNGRLELQGSDPDFWQDLTADPDGNYVASAIQHVMMKDGVTLSETRMETTNGELLIWNRASPDTANTHTGKIHLMSGGGNRLTVLRTGEIGIGDVDPYSKLTVVTGHKDSTSAIDNGNVVSVQSATGNTVQKLNLGVDSTIGNAFIQSVLPGTNSTPLLLNPAGGLVGVGKAPSTYQLDIHSSARIGDTSVTAASLVIEASNTAGSSAMTSQMTFIGYEGRGKGIFYNDISYSPTRQWFSGVPYNSTHSYYSIGFGSNQAEYMDQSLLLIESGSTGTGGVLLGEKDTVRTGESINTGWNYDVTKLDVRGRLAGGRVHNSNVFTKDLMLYADFNNVQCYSPELAANGRINDLSKNNYQIVPSGATYTTDNGIHVANFDGTNDYIAVNEFNNTDESISFEAWFKIDTWASGGANWNTIFDLGDQDGNPWERPLLGVLYDGVSAGLLRAYPSNVNFASDIQLGRWYHVVWAFNSNSDLDVYLNGQALGTGINWGSTMPTTSTATNGDTRLLIGGDGGAEGMDGKLGIVRVYDKQLTSDEVTRNYNADALRFGHGGYLHDNTLYLAQDGSPTLIDKGTREFNIYAEDGIAFKANGSYTFPMIQGDTSGNLELIANARPANTGQNHRVVIKAGGSTGGGPAEIARFTEGTTGVGKLSVNYEAETSYAGYFYNHVAEYNASGKPTSVLGVAARSGAGNEGPSIDFYNIWAGSSIYHPSSVSTGWATGRIASVYDSTVSNGGSLAFYTTSGPSAQGGANYENLLERLRIDPVGRVVVADAGSIRLGDTALVLPKQSFINPVSAGGADTWYKLCEVDNPWKGEINYFVGCSNAEEHGVIKVKTTWTVSNLQLEVERQTYNPMLKEVRLSASTSGANYEIWVRLHSDSAQLVNNCTFRYNIVNAMVYEGGSPYFRDGGVVAYFNTSGTPATNRTSVVLDDSTAAYNNVQHLASSQVITSPNGSVAQTLQTTSDIALRLHGKNAWTGIQFTDNTDAGTGATLNMFYNGTYTGGQLSIGGGGGATNGKRLHVDGGTSIGSTLDNTAVPTDGLRVQGDIRGDGYLGLNTTPVGNAHLEINADFNYDGIYITGTDAVRFTVDPSNDWTSPPDPSYLQWDRDYFSVVYNGGTIQEVDSNGGSTDATTWQNNIGSGYVNNIIRLKNTNMGVGVDPDTNYKLKVNGAFSATSKSFDIEHPTKEGMRLHHGSLEGPEHGVYVRGRLTDSNVIVLPDYWTGLVDKDTITVQLTAIGGKQNLWVEDIVDNSIIVGFEDKVNCFYFVQAERKDIDKFDVEYEA